MAITKRRLRPDTICILTPMAEAPGHANFMFNFRPFFLILPHLYPKCKLTVKFCDYVNERLSRKDRMTLPAHLTPYSSWRS